MSGDHLGAPEYHHPQLVGDDIPFIVYLWEIA